MWAIRTGLMRSVGSVSSSTTRTKRMLFSSMQRMGRGRVVEKTVRRFDKLRKVKPHRLSSVLSNRDAFVETLKMGWECGMYEDTIDLHDELGEELERRYGFESGLDIFEILIRCCYHIPVDRAPYDVARRIMKDMYKKNVMINMRILRVLAFLAREDRHNCQYVRGLMRDVWARLETPNANDYAFKIDVYSLTGQPEMARRALMDMSAEESSVHPEPRHYTAVIKSFLGHPQGMEVAQALLDEMIQTGQLPPPFYGDDETLLSHDQVNAYGYAIRIALECGSAEQTLSYFTALNSSLTDNLLVKDTNRIFNALREYGLNFVERAENNERTTQTNKNCLDFAKDLLVLLRPQRESSRDIQMYINCVYDYMKACHHCKEYTLALSAYESLVAKPDSELYAVRSKTTKLHEIALNLCSLSADERNLNIQMPRIGFVWEIWARLNNDPMTTSSQTYGLRFLRFLLKASRRELVHPLQQQDKGEERRNIFKNLVNMWQTEINWNDSAAQSAALARVVHILSVRNDPNSIIEISKYPAYTYLVSDSKGEKLELAAQDLCETHGSTLCLSYSIALLPVFVSRSYYQLGRHDEAIKALEPLESIRDEWDKCIHEYATRAFETKNEAISVHDREICGYAVITSPRVSKINKDAHNGVVDMICRHYGLFETSLNENDWRVLSEFVRE